MAENKTPGGSEPLTADHVMRKPLKVRHRREPAVKRLSKKKLDFEAVANRGEKIEEMIKETDKLKLDPSSPVRIYEQGYYELRSRLAPCYCYIRAETCGQRPCICSPDRSHCYPEKNLSEMKNVSLKCTCTVDCIVYESAQEPAW